MTTYKVKYKHYIVNLYLPTKCSGRTVLLLPGLPMSTNLQSLIQALLKEGMVVYYPYFSGSFDSGGRFSASQCIKDVAELYPLTQMAKVTELYFGKELTVGTPHETILMGMSYGACVALLGHNNLYKKIVLLSPALLFNSRDIGGNEGETFNKEMKSLLVLLKKAYSYTYRVARLGDLKEFLMGRKIGKKEVVQSLNNLSCPTMVLHGERDNSVSVTTTQSLEGEVSNKHISWRYADVAHSISSYSGDVLTQINDFIKA